MAVSKRYAGEQETFRGKRNKELTSLKMVISICNYSQLPLRRTPLGPAVSVRLREMSYRESNKGSKGR